jgi:hypothetical protein
MGCAITKIRCFCIVSSALLGGGSMAVALAACGQATIDTGSDADAQGRDAGRRGERDIGCPDCPV